MARPTSETTIATGIRVQTASNPFSVSQTAISWTRSKRTYSGVTTPGFGTVKQRHLPLNPYTLNIQLNTGQPGQYTDVVQGPFGGTYTTSWQDCSARFTGPPSAWSNARAHDLSRNKAVSRLITKVTPGGFNALQSLCEANQTANLVLRNARRLAWAAHALKHGNLKEMYRSLKLDETPSRKEYARIERTRTDERLAKHWMEYINGWRPFVSEVDSALEALAFRVLDEKNRATAKASGRHVETHVFSDPSWGHGNSNKVTVDTCTTKFIVKYGIQSEARSFAAQFRLNNLPLLAWELLPHSYIADWVFNVSDFLTSLAAFDGYELLEGQEVMFRRIVTVCDYNYSKTESGTLNKHVSSGYSSHMEVQYVRSTLTSWPSQTLVIRSKLDNSTNEKIATVAATLRQLFRPKRERGPRQEWGNYTD